MVAELNLCKLLGCRAQQLGDTEFVSNELVEIYFAYAHRSTLDVRCSMRRVLVAKANGGRPFLFFLLGVACLTGSEVHAANLVKFA